MEQLRTVIAEYLPGEEKECATACLREPPIPVQLKLSPFGPAHAACVVFCCQSTASVAPVVSSFSPFDGPTGQTSDESASAEGKLARGGEGADIREAAIIVIGRAA